MALGGPESILWRAQVAPEALSGTEKSVVFGALVDLAKQSKDPKEIQAAQKAALWFGRESILDLFRAVQQNPVLKKAIQERIDEGWKRINEGHQKMAGILLLGEDGLKKHPLSQVEQLYDGKSNLSHEQRRMVAIAWGKRVLREGLDEDNSLVLIDFIVTHPRDGQKEGSIDTEAALELAGAALEGVMSPIKPQQQKLFP